MRYNFEEVGTKEEDSQGHKISPIFVSHLPSGELLLFIKYLSRIYSVSMAQK